MYTKLTDLPDTIQKTLHSLGYHSKDISLEVSESVSPFVGSGDGLRGFCVILDIITGQSETKMGSWGGSNAFSPNNSVDCDTSSYKIPSNVAVIKGTTGRDRVYATITLSPENVIKALPLPTELDQRLKWILFGYKGLTSSGRKNEYDRYRDKPSAEDLKKLVELGLLKMNKAGVCQITTEGKNCFKALEHVEHPKGFRY